MCDEAFVLLPTGQLKCTVCTVEKSGLNTEELNQYMHVILCYHFAMIVVFFFPK